MAFVVNKDPRVAESFVNRFGLKYAPDEFSYRFRAFWDTQDVGAAATSATATEFYNTSTSSRGSHTKGVAGCNLFTIGRIPGGSIFVVTAVELVAVVGAAATSAIAKDWRYLVDGGLVEGLYLNNKQVTEEFHVSEALVAEGINLETFDNVAAAGAGVVIGYHGLTDGAQFSPETLPLITSDDAMKLPISYNGYVAMSGAVKLRTRLRGMLATRK